MVALGDSFGSKSHFCWYLFDANNRRYSTRRQSIEQRRVRNWPLYYGAFSCFFYYLELETIIKPSGIYVRFFPFHFSFKHYPWDSIRKCYVKQYSPIGDFGGWGVRISLFGKGTAYNVDGDYGLQLEFLTPKKLLIGTQKPQELTEALDLANLTKL